MHCLRSLYHGTVLLMLKQLTMQLNVSEELICKAYIEHSK